MFCFYVFFVLNQVVYELGYVDIFFFEIYSFVVILIKDQRIVGILVKQEIYFFKGELKFLL